MLLYFWKLGKPIFWTFSSLGFLFFGVLEFHPWRSPEIPLVVNWTQIWFRLDMSYYHFFNRVRKVKRRPQNLKKSPTCFLVSQYCQSPTYHAKQANGVFKLFEVNCVQLNKCETGPYFFQNFQFTTMFISVFCKNCEPMLCEPEIVQKFCSWLSG